MKPLMCGVALAHISIIPHGVLVPSHCTHSEYTHSICLLWLILRSTKNTNVSLDRLLSLGLLLCQPFILGLLEGSAV